MDKIVPGTRVSVVAISALMNTGPKQKQLSSSAVIRTPYLKVVGIQIDTNGGGRMSTIFTAEEV